MSESTASEIPDTELPPPETRGGLSSASFLGLLVTQLLGAANDNVFRWLVIGVGKQYVPHEQIGNVLMAGTASFVLPYILLAAPAGYVADRFSKRSVIVACKVAEIIIMALGIAAIVLGNLGLLLATVALIGSQSAMFGPAKLGSIPEMLRPERLSAANGLMGLSTIIATVVGMGIGMLLVDATGARGQEGWWLSAAVVLGIAIVGWFTSLMIRPLPAGDPTRRFPWNAPLQTFHDVKVLAESRPLLRIACGMMFFWSLASMAQLNIDQYAFEGGATAQSQVIPLLGALVIGVGLGSVLAGLWSGDRVELGILPLGAGGIVISSCLLFLVEGTLIEPGNDWTTSFVAACAFLGMLGVSAGLFDVPLAAFMQHRSPVHVRGSILAASNFLTFSGVLASSIIFSLLRAPGSGGEPRFSSREIFLLCGISTVPVFLYIVCLIPQVSIRFVIWLATSTVYRVRVKGRENLPAQGGALLVANHVTWMDGLLLLVTSSRPVRFLVWGDLINSAWKRWLARTMGVIPIKSSPKLARQAMETAHEALADGELVCIFPEGELSRSGQLQGFKRGLTLIIKGVSAPVIPTYLDELWGSIFSFAGGKYFWKWPKRLPYPVSIWFGPPMADLTAAEQARQAVQDLGAEAVSHRVLQHGSLGARFIRKCRKRLFKSKVADSSGSDLKGLELMMRTLILRRLLARHVLGLTDEYVGILLPPSTGGVIVNAAVTLSKRISANLNYTATSEVLNNCIEQAKIKHVLTSRRVMEKLSLKLDADVVYLEDFKDKVTLVDKIVSVVCTLLLPAGLTTRLLGLGNIGADDVATVIFTSGSTGRPKGVLLTHRNVISNIEAIDQIVQLRSDDVLLGILPFFHSFGFTVALWAVLSLDIKGIYHFSPLDARQVGKLCQEHKGTVLLGTPTFLRGYIKRCTKEELGTLEVVVVGAEKMPLELADAFEEKFGVRPVEGYGTTELSPLVSVNVPPKRSRSTQVDLKEGTVGRTAPGITAKVIDPETSADLEPDTPGMLLVKGPNVMRGYLGQPEKTAEVIRDGWYVTGDIAQIDKDGFITITGRLSRFSKIGGEMVPHILIEEELNKIVGSGEEQCAAVTALPDERKGERLIVLYTHLPAAPDEINRQLSATGMPNLWIPSPDSYFEVPKIPVLGTGKLDLQGLKSLAEEKVRSEK